ncbi:hypothetical protein HDU77_009653, partial [Chytriomyces hyalinus]
MGMGKRGNSNSRSTGLLRQSLYYEVLCTYLDNKKGLGNADYGQSEVGVMIVGKGQKAGSDDDNAVNSNMEFNIEQTIKKQRDARHDENSDPKGKKGLVPAISAMSKDIKSLAASMAMWSNPVTASENSKIKQLLAALVQKNNTLETAVSQMSQELCNINNRLNPLATSDISPTSKLSELSIYNILGVTDFTRHFLINWDIVLEVNQPICSTIVSAETGLSPHSAAETSAALTQVGRSCQEIYDKDPRPNADWLEKRQTVWLL